MKRNETWVKVGSSVAAALICYLVINVLTDKMGPLWKTIIIATVGIIALAFAFWGGKKSDQDNTMPPAIEIASDIEANGDLTIEKVRVDAGSGGDIKIGTDITSEKNVNITNINVSQKVKS